MSNDYLTKLLVDQRIAELHHEADEDRLGRLARAGQRRPRWWERLMLFRAGTRTTGDQRHADPRQANRPAASQPAVTVAASDSPC